MKPYEKRLVREYEELVERRDKLQNMLMDWEGGELDFEPECTMDQLYNQLDAMEDYVNALEERNDFYRLKEEGHINE